MTEKEFNEYPVIGMGNRFIDLAAEFAARNENAAEGGANGYDGSDAN